MTIHNSDFPYSIMPLDTATVIHTNRKEIATMSTMKDRLRRARERQFRRQITELEIRELDAQREREKQQSKQREQARKAKEEEKEEANE